MEGGDSNQNSMGWSMNSSRPVRRKSRRKRSIFPERT